MVNKDYRQEIGAEPGTKTVPWSYALLILAVLAAAGWFGVRWLIARDDRAHPRTQPTHSASARTAR